MVGVPRWVWGLGGAGFLLVWLLYATGGLMYFFAVGQIFFMSQKMQHDIREVEALGEPNPRFAPKLAVEGADQGDDKKPGYVALSYHDVLHENRSVSVQTEVRLTDLLAEGEALPEPELMGAFVQARAARVADAECRLLEQALASRCIVRSSSGTAGKDGSASIGITMGFVQKTPFGAVPAGPRAAYVESQERIGGDRPQPIALSAASEARARAYEEIAGLCDRLRESQGNCAIANASVVTRAPPYGGGRGEMTAVATLSSLTALPGAA
jgi:hypothetical protein